DDEVGAADLVEVVDVDDVLVLQRRDRQRLALEADGELRILGDRGLERLDGDGPVEALLHGLVDDRHAARADLLDDAAVSDAIDHGEPGRLCGRPLPWSNLERANARRASS